MRSAPRAPFLQPAFDAVDDLSPDRGDEAVEALGAGKEATKALLDAVGQGDNATAVSTATQLLSQSNRSGHRVQGAHEGRARVDRARVQADVQGFVEPEPEEPPPPPPPKGEGGAKAAGGTKKKKKGKGRRRRGGGGGCRVSGRSSRGYSTL